MFYYFVNVLDGKRKHSEKDLNWGYFVENINLILIKNKKGRAFDIFGINPFLKPAFLVYLVFQYLTSFFNI